MPRAFTPASLDVGLPRRRALQRSAAATLAAARTLAPGLFAGCSLGIPPKAATVYVGQLHSQTGALSLGATSLRDVELHAFERINADGGILGRQIVGRAPDTRSRPDVFVRQARRLLDEGAVALFGCWTSASRKAVLPLLEEYRRLLFYPLQYEGNESARHVIYGGSVPNQQVLPAIDWLLSPAGGAKRKIFLIGSDYVYPWTVNYIVTRYLDSMELRPVGVKYLPLGHRDFSTAVQQILFTEADCVLSTVNGSSNVGLFAALSEARVDPEKVPVVSTSIGEDDLRSLPAHQAVGHYATSSYFQTVATEANRLWVDGFRAEFGRDRVTSDPMEADWCLVQLWKTAVEKAGSFETEAVLDVLREGLAVGGPGGSVRLDPRTRHCTRFFRLGRVRPDRQFEIVDASEAPIDPDPYPQVAFPGWKCDWTGEGVTRGQEVTIDGDV